MSLVQRETEEKDALVPFLKWPGGKRWFVSQHADLLPTSFGKYVEPFLGAGAVFFHLKPASALLGDMNADLIEAYRTIKTEWQALENSLTYRQRQHRGDPDGYYYRARAKVTNRRVERASRLIYLNRTCFNGLYRVNQHGHFNVPRGSKNQVLFPTDNFAGISRLLKSAELVTGDFEGLVNRANDDDFVFCDPPYTVRHNDNGFRKYNEVLFSWSDQERLARALLQAAKRGAKVLCTNANHPCVRELYSDSRFEQKIVSRTSRVSADGGSRRRFEELVVRANIK